MPTQNWWRLTAIALLLPLGVFGLNDLHAALFTPRASLPPEVVADIRVGDVVFTREPYLLPRKIADASGAWTNHVGVVIDTTGPEPIVAESKVPFSRETRLSRFVHRSEAGYVAIRRPIRALSAAQQEALSGAAHARLGILYDTGFDLDSSRQFCSKFVYENLKEATGMEIGKVVTFANLLEGNAEAPVTFWKIWYLGRIPWQRKTVTPASQYLSSDLVTLYDATEIEDLLHPDDIPVPVSGERSSP